MRKRTSLHLTTNLVFSEWSKVFTDKKMTTAMRNRIMRVHRDRQRLLSLQTEDEISQLTQVNVGR
ncbi:ATP-binding protein [Aeromonas caviae]|uniref:ATP-binding protein n=1 Tax=Aeromonas caviae TaxID=648 RepID=UPI0039905918